MTQCCMPTFQSSCSRATGSKIVGLKDFDREARSAKRPDVKHRLPALPGGRFFVATSSAEPDTQVPDAPVEKEVVSTYREAIKGLIDR